MASIYMIGSVFTLISLVLYYTKKADTIYYLVIYSTIRSGIRLVDFEETRDLIGDDEWMRIGII